MFNTRKDLRERRHTRFLRFCFQVVTPGRQFALSACGARRHKRSVTDLPKNSVILTSLGVQFMASNASAPERSVYGQYEEGSSGTKAQTIRFSPTQRDARTTPHFRPIGTICL